MSWRRRLSRSINNNSGVMTVIKVMTHRFYANLVPCESTWHLWSPSVVWTPFLQGALGQCPISYAYGANGAINSHAMGGWENFRSNRHRLLHATKDRQHGNSHADKWMHGGLLPGVPLALVRGKNCTHQAANAIMTMDHGLGSVVEFSRFASHHFAQTSS